MEKLSFRYAQRSDLGDIVALLADDELGAKREDLSEPLAECYVRAFEEIERNSDNNFIVVCRGERIIGFNASHYGMKKEI